MFPARPDHPTAQMLHDAGAGGDTVGAIHGQIAIVRVDIANGVDAVARGVRPPGAIEGLVPDAIAVQAFELPQAALVELGANLVRAPLVNAGGETSSKIESLMQVESHAGLALSAGDLDVPALGKPAQGVRFNRASARFDERRERMRILCTPRDAVEGKDAE